MRWCLAIKLLVISAALTPGLALAKDDKKQRPTWDFAVGVEQGYTDNVRWAEDGPQKDPAWLTTIGGEVTWHNERSTWLPSQIMGGVRGRVYSEYSDRDFAEIYTKMEKKLGDNTLLLRYKYIPEQLRLEDDPDEGATFSMDNELAVGAERKMGPRKRLRVRLWFEAEWDEATDGTASERDSFTAAGVTNLRYRLHEIFQPHVEGRYGVRDAKSSNYDRDEANVEVGFVSRPWALLGDLIPVFMDLAGLHGRLGDGAGRRQLELRPRRRRGPVRGEVEVRRAACRGPGADARVQAARQRLHAR